MSCVIPSPRGPVRRWSRGTASARKARRQLPAVGTRTDRQPCTPPDRRTSPLISVRGDGPTALTFAVIKDTTQRRRNPDREHRASPPVWHEGRFAFQQLTSRCRNSPRLTPETTPPRSPTRAGAGPYRDPGDRGPWWPRRQEFETPQSPSPRNPGRALFRQLAIRAGQGSPKANRTLPGIPVVICRP